jgi:hypothetical protein
MADPIVHAPSDSQSLVDAIRQATAQDSVLLLAPGVHLTPELRIEPIAISPNGLTVRSQDPLNPAIIRRPAYSIDLDNPDDHHGLFFIPAPPSDIELGVVQWHPGMDPETHTPMTFGVVIRGEVRFDNVVLDCNMAQQGAETLDLTDPEQTLEHSCMIGFRGDDTRPADQPGRVYVGFRMVSLTRLETRNGGYADDIWFSRGGFYPNIEQVDINDVRSGPRVGPKRSTVNFSGLCLRISITDCDIFELGMEDATNTNYDMLPRATPYFERSRWVLSNVTMKRLDLAARGKVYDLQGWNLDVTESARLYQPGGTISNSRLHVGAETERRLERFAGLTFRDVVWTLDPQPDGELRGLRPFARNGEECRVRFVRNRFQVPATATHGQIIDSETTDPDQHNRVQVWVLDCRFPASWGMDSTKLIAKIEERGLWWFTPSSLEGRNPDIACPVNAGVDGITRVVMWWPTI